MERNQIIILALIVIIASLLIGIVAVMPNMNKTDTNLKFKSKSPLTEGDSIKIKLTESNGTAIANQTVNITITGKNNSSDYHSVVTNKKGVGTLKLDKSPGKYKINLAYGGNDKYNGCNASKAITIKEEVIEAEPASSSDSSDYSSSSGSSLPYSVDNLPPSNDPNPETRRYQVDENTVIQEYSDNYRSVVDLRTGERHGGWF